MPAKSLQEQSLDRIVFGPNHYLGQPDKAVAEILRALKIDDIDAFISYCIKRHWVQPCPGVRLNWVLD